MRLPSLVRLPRNRNFKFEPRYYDPIKEEIEEKTARFKEEMNAEGYVPKGNISFQRKSESLPNASLLQLVIAACLGFAIVGWLQFGNNVFYAILVFIPVYIFIRLKKVLRK